MLIIREKAQEGGNIVVKYQVYTCIYTFTFTFIYTCMFTCMFTFIYSLTTQKEEEILTIIPKKLIDKVRELLSLNEEEEEVDQDELIDFILFEGIDEPTFSQWDDVLGLWDDWMSK